MPPFSGIPYGPAPSFAFPIFEIGMYVLFILCLINAIKKGIGYVAYLIGGLCFGLLLEYINVVTNMGYTYGKFMVMFGKAPFDIPLCIGVGWAIIMYGAKLFTDTFKLPLWASAAMDTLLAISIDLSMDTVAYRLHMWHWNWESTGQNPLTAEWFGIPYGNFFGWLCVVFFYSAFNRLLNKWMDTTKTNSFKQAIIPFLSVILSQVLLYVTLVYIDNYLKEHFGITALHRFLFSMIMLLITVAYGLRKRMYSQLIFPAITWLVPAFFHVYFFVLLFTQGFYKENMYMVVVPTVIIFLSVIAHYKPTLKMLEKPNMNIA